MEETSSQKVKVVQLPSESPNIWQDVDESDPTRRSLEVFDGAAGLRHGGLDGGLLSSGFFGLCISMFHLQVNMSRCPSVGLLTPSFCAGPASVRLQWFQMFVCVHEVLLVTDLLIFGLEVIQRTSCKHG